MPTLPPPTTGMKKKARRVFGDTVVDDVDSSLSYSPSPVKTSNDEANNNSASDADAGPPTGLSPLMEDDQSPSSTRSSSSSGSSNRSTFPSSGSSNRSTFSSSSSGSSSGSSSDSVSSDAGKENSRKMQQQKSSMIERVRNKHYQKHTRSPLRRDLVKMTQDKINQASISVNHSLQAARAAKEAEYRQKSKQTGRFRQEWKEDASDAKEFVQNAQKNRLELLALKRELSSKYSKERAHRERMKRQAKLQSVEEESQFKSAVYRDHKHALKKEDKERRRKSTAVRARIRVNNREGENKMKMQQIQEDQAIIEERYEASVALRNTKQQNADQRRKSFAFRNGDARRIRELHALMEAERMEKEHDSFELKMRGEKDADEYRRQLAEDRRQSFANRNALARTQREQANDQQSQQQVADHESYELKRAAEKDAEAYKRSVEEQRRLSHANRNAYARQQREQESQERSAALVEEHESFELKRAAEKDAQLYLIRLEEQRRESFAFRNQEGKRQRDLVKDQEAKAAEIEHEGYELKWAGEKDAEAYKRKLEQERRESFAGRNAEGWRRRQQGQQEHSEDLAKQHESFALKWAGEKDAEAYQRQVAQERRQSLAGRNAESARHAKVMEELRALAQEKETESYVLKWAGENDAKKYMAELDEERRESLRQRGKQTVHHREVESRQQQQELIQTHEDEDLRAADHRDVKAYRKECAERDRMSLEYRRKDARKQRLEEEERLLQQHVVDERNFDLDSLARTDVEEYVKDCKARRRLSLAFRAKERRHHAQWKKEQNDREIAERSRRVRAALMDQRRVELARQEERARKALDAIRHSGCSFNPFAGVMI